MCAQPGSTTPPPASSIPSFTVRIFSLARIDRQILKSVGIDCAEIDGDGDDEWLAGCVAVKRDLPSHPHGDEHDHLSDGPLQVPPLDPSLGRDRVPLRADAARRRAARPPCQPRQEETQPRIYPRHVLHMPGGSRAPPPDGAPWLRAHVPRELHMELADKEEAVPDVPPAVLLTYKGSGLVLTTVEADDIMLFFSPF